MITPTDHAGRGYATPELDQTILAEFVQAVGREGALQLINTLLTDLSERLAEFRRALQRNDLALAGSSAHRLKSSVAYIGGTRFSEFCRELEGLARARDGAALRASMPLLEARIRQIEKELRAWLRR